VKKSRQVEDEENVVLIFGYMCGLSIYSSKGKKILWVSLCMLFSFSLQTPTIEDPMTPNTAVTKTAVIKRQRKCFALSRLPSFLSTVFGRFLAQKKKTNASNAAWCPNKNDRKSVKCKAEQEKGNGVDSESRVNPREKVCIRSRRHAQDKTVAAYSRLRYCEASTRLQKA